MNIGGLGRFLANTQGMTNDSLKPSMEGTQSRSNIAAGTKEIPDIPFGDNNPAGVGPIGTSKVSFGNTLEGMLREVSSLQQQAATNTNQLMTGEVEDVHQVMVAVEKASTSFMMMMEIRNKLVEAYREVMRTQV